ncbi:hypothetical protein Tco_1351697 [Tanacetum coccineum]
MPQTQFVYFSGEPSAVVYHLIHLLPFFPRRRSSYGSGSFVEVHLATDVDTFEILAVKIVLYLLSDLTYTDENFIAKSGAQRVASTEGLL